MRRLPPLLLCGLLPWLALSASAVTIDWTVVGNPGNAADTSGYGAVGHGYRIGTTEVSNSQYAEFLNAVASTADLTNGADPNALYNTEMGSHAQGGIERSGNGLLNDYSYTVTAGFENKPVNFVSVFDAFRFSNWLHNGQPSGAQDDSTTELGSYVLEPGNIADNSVVRAAGATIVLTNENEWYKAAYYDAVSASYFDYASGSDLAPACTAPTAAPNSANCDAPGLDASDADVDGLTDVGAFSGSASPYGTADQGGNVWEWNETRISGAFRGLRGGSSDSSVSSLNAATRGSSDPNGENAYFGFRVAMVPEPGTGLLLMFGLFVLARQSKRAQKGSR